MKRKILSLGTVLLLSAATATSVSYAQTQKEINKERKEALKQSKAELNDKASKAARNDAKTYKKEGWMTTPGALPIEKQLDKSYLMQYEIDDYGYPKYLMGEAMSIGENYDAAKMQAMELAKQNLAGQIQAEIETLVETQIANEQLSAEQAASITQSFQTGKSLIFQSIGRVIPVVEVYRIKNNKNKEVLVRIAYNAEMAKEVAKKAIRRDLEKKGSDLAKQLDELLCW
jgi:hypothetical protein